MYKSLGGLRPFYFGHFSPQKIINQYWFYILLNAPASSLAYSTTVPLPNCRHSQALHPPSFLYQLDFLLSAKALVAAAPALVTRTMCVRRHQTQ